MAELAAAIVCVSGRVIVARISAPQWEVLALIEDESRFTTKQTTKYLNGEVWVAGCVAAALIRKGLAVERYGKIEITMTGLAALELFRAGFTPVRSKLHESSQ